MNSLRLVGFHRTFTQRFVAFHQALQGPSLCPHPLLFISQQGAQGIEHILERSEPLFIQVERQGQHLFSLRFERLAGLLLT